MCESGRIENSLLSQIILVLWSGTLDSPSARELSHSWAACRRLVVDDPLLLTVPVYQQLPFVKEEGGGGGGDGRGGGRMHQVAAAQPDSGAVCPSIRY